MMRSQWTACIALTACLASSAHAQPSLLGVATVQPNAAAVSHTRTWEKDGVVLDLQATPEKDASWIVTARVRRTDPASTRRLRAVSYSLEGRTLRSTDAAHEFVVRLPVSLFGSVEATVTRDSAVTRMVSTRVTLTGDLLDVLPRRNVSGRVVLLDGRPAPNLYVRLVGLDIGISYPAITNPNGGFYMARVPVSPNPVRVQVRWGDMLVHDEPLDLAKTTGDVTVVLNGPRARVP